MGAQPSHVFYPTTFQELFTAWESCPDAVPFGGGTEIMRNQGRRVPALPQNILCLDKLEELRRVTRTERYLEIGAMVALNDILYKFGKAVPEVLVRCIEGIAGPSVRSLATIGGNLCYKRKRLNAFAPMIALDATFELRGLNSARWIAASRFDTLVDNWTAHEILSRIRVPLEQWDYSLYRKFTIQETQSEEGAAAFILRNEKNVLSDLRIVFAGKSILRDKNSETLLIGKKLPLNKREALNFLEHWATYLDAIEGTSPLFQAVLLSFIKAGIKEWTLDL